jgi:hypothetical protein
MDPSLGEFQVRKLLEQPYLRFNLVRGEIEREVVRLRTPYGEKAIDSRRRRNKAAKKSRKRNRRR